MGRSNSATEIIHKSQKWLDRWPNQSLFNCWLPQCLSTMTALSGNILSNCCEMSVFPCLQYSGIQYRLRNTCSYILCPVPPNACVIVKAQTDCLLPCLCSPTAILQYLLLNLLEVKNFYQMVFSVSNASHSSSNWSTTTLWRVLTYFPLALLATRLHISGITQSPSFLAKKA